MLRNATEGSGSEGWSGWDSTPCAAMVPQCPGLTAALPVWSGMQTMMTATAAGTVGLPWGCHRAATGLP